MSWWIDCQIEERWDPVPNQLQWRKFRQWPLFELTEVHRARNSYREFLMRLSGERLPIYVLRISFALTAPSTKVPLSEKVIGVAILQFAVDTRLAGGKISIRHLGSDTQLMLCDEAVILKESNFIYFPFQVNRLYFFGQGYSPHSGTESEIEKILIEDVIIPTSTFLIRNHILRSLSFRDQRSKFILSLNFRPDRFLLTYWINKRGLRHLLYLIILPFTRTGLEKILKLERILFESLLLSSPSFRGLRFYKDPKFDQRILGQELEYEESYRSLKEILFHERTDMLKTISILIAAIALFIAAVSLALTSLPKVIPFFVLILAKILRFCSLASFLLLKRLLSTLS